MLDVCVGQFPSKSLRWAYIGRGDLTEGFLRYGLGGLMFGGAHTWTGLFSEFYGISLQSATAFYYKVRQALLQSATILLQSATIITKCARTLHEWLLTYLSRTCILHIFYGHLQCRKIVIPHQASYGFSSP